MRLLKKYSSGQGSHYISRTQALLKLQLSLKDFRRLCIIKGIYPREPNNRRVAQKGSTEIKILYHTKDIKFLLHEPIVWTLRDYKIFHRRIGRDRAVRDFRNMKRKIENSPEMKMDHVVKERYPTFIDAVKDLDDCLTLLFLFSTFPSLKFVDRKQSDLCRRLTIEFMHAVIASKSLRKVFISIKGYYFQANIKGQLVTWIVPHYYPFAPHHKQDVDFKVMSIFVEFYTIMLGFVNFRLYQSFNVQYPPQFNELSEKEIENNLLDETAFVSERIAALTIDLVKTDASVAAEDDEEIDLDLLTTDGDSAKLVKMKEQMRSEQKLKSLFKGLKFFINREVPREPLVFIIRCFGGQVSWEKTLYVGAQFNESDESITHQIVDRQNIGKKYISRDYIQPQWIFDCVNQVKLLKTNKYFIGVDLPPHLSPFVDPERDTYVPPEERAIHDPTFIESNYADEEEENNDIEEDMTENHMDEELEKAFREEAEELGNSDESENYDNDDETSKKDKLSKQKKKKMAVKSGELYKENTVLNHIQEMQTDKLQTRMVRNRHRYLYKKLLREKKIKDHETNLLSMKRRMIDEEIKSKKTTVKQSEPNLDKTTQNKKSKASSNTHKGKKIIKVNKKSVK